MILDLLPGRMISALAMWTRLIFMIFTHRAVKLAPGAYIQVRRGTSDKEIAAAIRNFLEGRR